MINILEVVDAWLLKKRNKKKKIVFLTFIFILIYICSVYGSIFSAWVIKSICNTVFRFVKVPSINLKQAWWLSMIYNCLSPKQRKMLYKATEEIKPIINT